MNTQQSYSGTSSPVGETLRDGARQAGEQVKQQASALTEKVARQGRELAGRQKEQLTATLDCCSDALRKAAEHLHGEHEDRIAGVAESIAGGVHSASDYLRQRDLPALYHDIESFVRRRPAVIFGALFVVGFALARFIKASEPGDHGSGRLYASLATETEDPVWVGEPAAAQPVT